MVKRKETGTDKVNGGNVADLYSTLFNIDLVYTNIKYDSTLYFYMYSVF
jgi:hypothetical protein